MSGLQIAEVAAAAALLVAAAVSASRTVAMIEPDDSGRVRVLIVLHATAKGGFWLGLAGFFLAYAFLDEPQGAQVLLLIPLVMAGVRLLTAQALARSLPHD